MLKSFLKKINFALGKSPRITGSKDFRKFIPEPYRSVLLITADFELAWAWRFSKDIENPKATAKYFARQARNNMPQILELCERYDIPITWMTVGHLFLESCSRNGHPPHTYLSRLKPFENNFWHFQQGDWFDDDPCSDWHQAPEWYGPDLIAEILKSKVEHEIGCHTFSHIDCRDDICSEEVFRDEMTECIQQAKHFELELESFVHPAHTIGNLKALSDLGFTSFRNDTGDVLGFPEKHPLGLWQFKNTAELTWHDDWSQDYHIFHFTRIVERALRHKRQCNLWFHPSMKPEFVEHVLPALFEFLHSQRDQIWVATTRSYTKWLNESYE